MPDEVTSTPETPAVDSASGDQNGTGRELTPAELKAELDRVRDALKKANNEAAKHRKDKDAAAKAQEAAAQAAALEQGKYKELYEGELAKVKAAEEKAAALELNNLRRKVAEAVKLPVGFAERLKGTTEEELTADANEMLKLMPKPGAPNLNAGTEDGALPPKSGYTDREIEEMAARYNVSAKRMREYLAQ